MDDVIYITTDATVHVSCKGQRSYPGGEGEGGDGEPVVVQAHHHRLDGQGGALVTQGSCNNTQTRHQQHQQTANKQTRHQQQTNNKATDKQTHQSH